MFLKLPFAVSFSALFITIQYAVFCKSVRTFYVSLCIYMCIYMSSLICVPIMSVEVLYCVLLYRNSVLQTVI